MAERTHSIVFLSYARADGENFAESLRERFRRKAPDIAVRQDRLFLEGGIGWWKQITDAIDSAGFLVLVMTPGAMNSEVVRKEWIYARQQGVCVYPVKAAPDDRLDFSSLPGWMRKVHFFDLGKEWATFVQHLRSPCTARRVAFMAPDLPASFVQRPVEFSRIKTCLIDPGRDEPVAITTSLAGAGGFGKTTLAAAICHDPDIIRNFDDGILWVTLGQTPDLVAAMLTIYAALTGDRPGFASVEDAAFQLAQKLQGLNCLLVIDDVWNSSHLRPFLRATGCARLFTTRDSAIASQAVRVTVDEMSESESLALLKHGIDAELSEFRALSRMLGEWPLALELARASIERRVLSGDTSENAIQYVERALGKKGLTFLAKDTAEARHQTIAATLALTTDLLSAVDRQRLCELAIFPEDIEIPVSAAGALWGTDEFDTGESAQTLARLSLLKLDLQRGTIGLHDVLRSWFARGVTNPAELHDRLVDAWPDWHNLSDAYAWEWLTWHLAQAGRHDDLIHLLWDPVWLPKKLEHTGPIETKSLAIRNCGIESAIGRRTA
jgi:hypothetical protein